MSQKEIYANGLKNALAEIAEHGMDFWSDDIKTKRVEIKIKMEPNAVVTVEYWKETIPQPTTAIWEE